MNQLLSTFEMTDAIKNELYKKVQSLPQITSLSDDFSFSSLLTSYGILREVGSPNDEIARFLFDSKTNQVVPRESLQARLIKLGNAYGVEIESTASDSLEIKAYGVRELLHPEYSFNADGTTRSLVIFPEAAFKIAKLQEIDLVIVKRWALNTIFGGFDPQKEYYQTNFWELENNDTLLFAKLIKNRQLAFLGTHDFIAHVANSKSEYWENLSSLAARVEKLIEKLVSTTKEPTMASLILPYTAGVILDDLAQPPSYASHAHLIVLEEVLINIENQSIPGHLPCTLSKFPKAFERVISLSRATLINDAFKKEAKNVVVEMIEEIKASIVFAGVEQSIGENLFSRIRRK